MKKLTIISIICLFSFQCEKGWLRELVNPTVEGCNISTACNYNPDVNKFDNTCEYVSCIDCKGMQHGVATIDSCGFCDAVASNDCVKDCDDVWGGYKIWDCDSVCNGTNILDNCNVCDADPSNDCLADCAGVWGGSAVKDECDICGGTGLEFCSCGDGSTSCECCCSDGQVRDCSGECGGSAVVDLCNVCDGENSCIDCAGVPFGKSELDNCGNCSINDSPSEYEYTATMTAIIKHDSEQVYGTGDMLVAFDINGSIRGVGIELPDVPFGNYQGTTLYEMQIRSNTIDDTITFNYYDKSDDVIYTVQETYPFVINEIIGNVTAPFELNLGSGENSVIDWVDANDCVQDCEGIWGGEAVIDICGVCNGDGDCEGIDCTTDNTSGYCQDLSVLQILIDNSSETINMNMDNNGDGIIEPLELGKQS